MSLLAKFALAVCIVVGCMSFAKVQADTGGKTLLCQNSGTPGCTGRVVGTCATPGGTVCVKVNGWTGNCDCAEPVGSGTACWCKAS